MAPAALLPALAALFFLGQVWFLGGVRIARGHGTSSAAAGYALAAAFAGLAVLMLAITGWMEWVRIDRKRRAVTSSVGILVPCWSRERPLAEFYEVAVTARDDGDDHWAVRLVSKGETVLVAVVRSREEAAALAERVGGFVGISPADPKARRLEAKARRAEAMRSTPVLEVTRAGEIVTLRLGAQRAEWRADEVRRGLLFGSTPAKGPGYIILWGESPGERRELVAWERFDPAAWSALCAGADRLREVFPEGVEIDDAADA